MVSFSPNARMMEIIDFEGICRVCWGSNDLKTVFNPEIPSLCEMLMALTPVEVCEENGLPTHLCPTCSDDLEKAFQFRNKCIDSDLRLKQYLTDNGIETTVQYVHDLETEETIETIHTTVAFNGSKPVESQEGDTEFIEIKSENPEECYDGVERENNNIKIENGKYNCNNCQKSYLQVRNLRRHIKQMHSDVKIERKCGNRIFRCSICQRIFSFKNALIRHLRVLHRDVTHPYFVFANGKRCCTAGINFFIEVVGQRDDQIKGIFGDIENEPIEEYVEEDEETAMGIDDAETINNPHNLNETTENSNDFSDKIEDDVELIEKDNQTVFVVTEDMLAKMIKLDPETEVINENDIESTIIEEEVEQDNNAEMVEVGDPDNNDKLKYKCQYCQKTYFAKNNLNRHIKHKHLPPPHEIVRNYKCSICGRGFARKGLLERHAETHFERVAYQCDKCGEVFDKNIKLRYHVIKHETSKKFQCDVCFKWFLRATTLRVHKRQHDAILPFPCSECSRAFSMRPALEAHMRTHSEHRPYVCEICRRPFRHPGHLETHMKLHTGERKYHCTMCIKRFTTSTHLKYHIKVHLDERNFKCEICERGFIHKSELKYHMLSHTRVKERPCPICNKLFARTNQVTKHLKQVHSVRRNF